MWRAGSSRQQLLAAAAFIGAVCLVGAFIDAVCLIGAAMVDLSEMGSRSVALSLIPMLQPQFLVRLPMRGVRRSVPLAIYLHDAALDPLYAEGEPVVVPYVWKGSNAAGYDPDVQNVFADMPMSAAAIKAAEDEFLNRGTAKKSLAKSCEKTGTCVPEVNAWDYLPVSEEKTLSKHVPGAPPINVWADMPLQY